MHHKNFKNSTANHNNPAHHKPDFPSHPAPESAPRRSFLTKFRERFQEKPATPEEVKQLRLNAQREVAKTQIQRAKQARPSRLDNIMGGGGGARQAGRRQQDQGGSWLLGPQPKSSGGGFLDSSSSPNFSFITGVEPQKSRGKRQQQDSFMDWF